MQGIGAVSGTRDHAIPAAVGIEDAAFRAGCEKQQAGNKDKLCTRLHMNLQKNTFGAVRGQGRPIAAPF
jgi:hypothetical protein